MAALGKRRIERAGIAIPCGIALLLSGCPWSSAGHLPNLESAPFDQSAEASAPWTAASAPAAPSNPSGNAASHPAEARSSGKDSPPPVASDRALLADDAWVHAIPPQEPSRRPCYRWRHAGADKLLAQPDRLGPDLRGALDDKNPIVAANAAIILARLGDPAGAEQLTAAVCADDAKLPMRCAAAEALGSLPPEPAVPRLRELADRFGRAPRENASAYLPEIHAELIRAMAQQAATAGDPRFAAAMRSLAPDVRLEAVRAWLRESDAPLPIEAVELRGDPDPRVRAAALSVLVRHRHPDAKALLLEALDDQDFQVRSAAIAGLGVLPEAAGREPLSKMLKDRSEIVRAQAVSALAADPVAEDDVLRMAKDKSWRVRLAVAESLRRFPGRAGASVAIGLLDDPSPAVQEKVVASMEAWDLARAGPVLLEAMGKLVVVTRKTASRQLAARWPPAAEFPSEGSPKWRAEVLARLQQRFRAQFGAVDGAVVRAGVEATRAPDATISPQTIERVEQLLRGLAMPDASDRERAVRELTAFGPALIGPLERLALDRGQALPESLYGEVLPVVSPVFALLEGTRTRDVVLRRRAASELAALCAERPLPLLAVERLASLAARETDSLVWQSLLAAVAADPREPAARLAYAAIGHGAPEVRRRACEHLAAHPDPRHVPVLMPALEDPSEVVVQAAARAVGLAGRVDDARPLQRLLLNLNESIRLEAAIALARLQDPSGPAALERMAYAMDPANRRQVAVVMGELADPAFATTLVRLLDDQQAVRRAALEALPKVVGQDVTAGEQIPADDLGRRIDLWKRWLHGESTARQ